MACQGFLVREACIGVLAGGTGFLLWSAVECPVMSFEMGLCVRCDFWAACMLTLRATFLRCWRICVVCLALELIGSWVVVGFGVGMEAFGWSLIT